MKKKLIISILILFLITATVVTGFFVKENHKNKETQNTAAEILVEDTKEEFINTNEEVNIIQEEKMQEDTKEETKETKEETKKDEQKETKKETNETNKNTKDKNNTSSNNNTNTKSSAKTSTKKSTEKKSTSSSNTSKKTTTKKESTTSKKSSENKNTTTSKSTNKSTNKKTTKETKKPYWCVDGGSHHMDGFDENEYGYYDTWDEAWEACKKMMKEKDYDSGHYGVFQCFCNKYYFMLEERKVSLVKELERVLFLKGRRF